MKSTSYNDSASRRDEDAGWGMAFVGVIFALIVAYGAYAFLVSNQVQPIDYGTGTVVYNNDNQAPQQRVINE